MFLVRKNQYCENDYTAKCNCLNAIPVKLPMAFFIELEQNISQLIWFYLLYLVFSKSLTIYSRVSNDRSNLTSY